MLKVTTESVHTSTIKVTKHSAQILLVENIQYSPAVSSCYWLGQSILFCQVRLGCSNKQSNVLIAS